MTAPAAGAEPRRRLHPLTPLLRGARLAVLAVVAISWQGYQNLGTQRWLLAVAAVAILVLIGSAVSYLVTGYHVVGRELRVYEGLVSRRTRTIPLERLQAVELVQPLLARLFGLAELRLEVVGASKTEAPLAFLRLDEARALRQRLLDLANIGRAGAAHAPAAVGAEATQAGVAAPVAELERPVHRVDNRDLVISQLLRPQWWVLPLGIAAPIFFFASEGDVNFIAVASTVTAVVGVVLQPVRTLLSEWRFSIARGLDGLRLRRGLLETRSQTVPAGRVQALAVQWPLLWRGHRWVRVRMEIAGVSTGNASEQTRAGLLPVGTVPVAEQVIAEVLPSFVLTSVAVHAPPRRARWLAPLQQRVLGYQVGPAAFATRDGLLTRQLVIVPYERVQSVRIRQGPLQRLIRVASVWADTAGGLTAAALHVDVAEAGALATELAERSRAARSSRDLG
jgi:putative membrane protein